MKIKRYQAESMAEALALIRSELGPEAVILSTKTSRRPGPLGFVQPPLVEVEAGFFEDEAPAEDGREELLPRESGQPDVPFQEQIETRETAADALLNYLEELGLSRRTSALVAESLVPTGVSIQSLPPVNVLAQGLRGLLDCAGEPRRSTVMVFVGPTGVGKTTSLAKIAARLALVHQYDVALLTVDTYRIGAVEQLRTYADILGMTLEVVRSPSDMQRAVKRLAGFQFLLVDTPGRSQRDDARLRELSEYVNSFVNCEVHLVLSATTGYRELQDIINRFEALEPTHYLFTKLDEAVRWTVPFEAGALRPLPVRYVTNGQEVPDDLEVARAADLVEGLLQGSSTSARRQYA